MFKTLISLLVFVLSHSAYAQAERWIYIGRSSSTTNAYNIRGYEVWYADRRTIQHPKPGVIFVWLKMESFSDDDQQNTATEPYLTETWKVKIDSKRRIYQRLDQTSPVIQIHPDSLFETVMDKLSK